MTRNWTADFAKFRSFLQGIDMDKYSNLRTIKTVEQDLPDQLFPLDLYYKYYWETTDFRDFDQVFEEYWTEKIAEIFKFIEVYFYGCSIQFVQEGLRARMYRIWMSILTQFDFQYLWNSLYPGELISNPTLDKTGIDEKAMPRKPFSFRGLGVSRQRLIGSKMIKGGYDGTA